MAENKERYTTIDAVPVVMSAKDVAAFLGISKGNAYTLMHSKDFPTMIIGSRMLVERDKFLDWMNGQHRTDCSYCI